MAAKKPIKRPTMEQAYKAAKKSTDKGIVGEGKDVLGAMGNSVKQQAEFVGAVGNAKVGKVLATPAGGSMLRAAMPKGSGAKAMGAMVGAKAKDAKANKARQATDSKYDKVSGKSKGTPVNTRPKKPKNKVPSGGGKPSQSGY